MKNLTLGIAVAALLTTALIVITPRGEGQGTGDARIVWDARTPISSLPFTIDRCGSYFLTGCLSGQPGQPGLTIDADDVTVDLNGFTLQGVPGSLSGIVISGKRRSIEIHDGRVSGWGADGLSGAMGDDVWLVEVGVVYNEGSGVLVGERALLDAVVIECNTMGAGTLGDQFVIRGGRIGSSGQDGFSAGDQGHAHGALFRGSVSIGADSQIEMSHFTYDGTSRLTVGAWTSLVHCQINVMSASGSAPLVTLGTGASLRSSKGWDSLPFEGVGVRLAGECELSDNDLDFVAATAAIEALGSGNVIRGNTVGLTGAGVGIVLPAVSNSNEVVGNHVVGRGVGPRTGIRVASNDNLVVENHLGALGGGTAIEVTGMSNVVGPVVDGATINGNCNPAANYVH